MKKAKFYVDYCFEAGSFEGISEEDDLVCGGNLSQRYWFELELTEDEFEELYQVWFDNNSELNNWDSDWQGHDALYKRIDGIGIHALNELLKQYAPEFVNPVNVYWEISKETEDAF